ncbi:MAG: DUF1203 domain-containing protein [Acidobacteriia bacterium]|nr:DUF1203 domain-containing protein [Terriglobia bacterium]
MKSDFQIVALSRENFVHLFSMSDAELAAQGARRLNVDENPGYPCRVSLMDAPIGETVILTPFKHHDVDSPYQSSGPIFVRESAQTAKPEVNEVPLMFHHRLLSVRAYGKTAMMMGAKVVEGRALEGAIKDFFNDRDIAYLHLHNAGAGCFNCLVQRP